MHKILSIIEKYLTPIGAKVGANKYMGAIRDGFVYTLPFTLTGSIFLLIAAFPVQGVSDFVQSNGWDTYLYMVSGVTFDLMAILAVLGISYHLAKANDDDSFVVAVLSLIVFIILLPNNIITESGDIIGGVIPKEFTGTKGVFTAMFVGLSVPSLFHYITKKGAIIKMPEQVPPAIQKSFNSVIPVAIIITIAWAGQTALITLTDYTTISEIIYELLQKPLQGIGNTFGGVIVVLFITNLLWFLGIHGATVVGGVTGPIFTANSLENVDLAAQGMLSLDQGANLVTMNLFDSFINNGGSGMTIGLVVIMATSFFKAKQHRELGKLALVPGIFTINEPIIFGLPVVLNPLYIIPFLLAPIVSAIITLSAIQIGFMPPFSGIVIPWTTPPIISGFLISGWQGSVVQIINIVISALIWIPFVKSADNIAYKREIGELNE